MPMLWIFLYAEQTNSEEKQRHFPLPQLSPLGPVGMWQPHCHRSRVFEDPSGEMLVPKATVVFFKVQPFNRFVRKCPRLAFASCVTGVLRRAPKGVLHLKSLPNAPGQIYSVLKMESPFTCVSCRDTREKNKNKTKIFSVAINLLCW